MNAVRCFLFSLALISGVAAQVPNLIPHQGRVAVNGVNVHGDGAFKFAIVNGEGTVTYWSNDGTSNAGSEPATPFYLPVIRGLYSVNLGDVATGNMQPIPASIFTQPDLRLRVWFSNGPLGFERLVPDQRLVPAAYLSDGAVTSAKLAPGSGARDIVVSGASSAVAANGSYITQTPGAAFHLPANPAAGDRVVLSSAVSGGYSVLDPQAWTIREQRRDWSAVHCSASGSVALAAENFGNLYLSFDFGTTWNPMEQTRSWRGVAVSADGTKFVAVVSVGHIYTSEDSGSTWTPRDAVRTWAAVAASADRSRMVAAVRGGFLYTTSDNGISWTPRNSPRAWTAVASSADGSRLVAAVGESFTGVHNGLIYTSTDYGVTWTPRAFEADWLSLASSADGTRLIAGTGDDYVYTSSDSGVTWSQRAHSGNWTGVASSSDGTRLLAVQQSGKPLVSTDSGVTWTSREYNRNWFRAASSADGSRLFAVEAPGGHIYTENTADAVIGGTFVRQTGGPGSQTTLVYSAAAGWTPQNGGAWSITPGTTYLPVGNVGIGTSSPRNLLSLGNAVADTKIALWDGGGADTYGMGIQSNQFRFHTGGPSARFSFLAGPQGTELMTIAGSGNIGIGTSAPNYPLSLGGTVGNIKLALFDSGGTGDSYGLGVQSAQFRFHLGNTAARYSFYDSENAGKEILTVKGTGQIGIGTSNPATLLQIGDTTIANSQGLIRLASRSGTGEAQYFWDIGVPEEDEVITGRNYSFIIDDPRRGTDPEVIVKWDTGYVGIGTVNPSSALQVNGTVTATAFNPPSDRNLKENFTPVDVREVLEKVAALPVSRWNFKEDPSVEHIGPMAQDFHAAFTTGTDERHIATVDADGVALAAIKGLHEIVSSEQKSRDEEIARLKAKNGELERRLQVLESLVREQPRKARRR